MTNPLHPFCATCRVRRVKDYRNVYCSIACVPHARRVEGGRKGRQDYIRACRAKRYAVVVAAIASGDEANLYSALAALERKAYAAGLGTGLRARQRKTAA